LPELTPAFGGKTGTSDFYNTFSRARRNDGRKKTPQGEVFHIWG
jgi:hypothetical protein